MGRWFIQLSQRSRSWNALRRALVCLLVLGTLGAGPAWGAGFSATLDRDSLQVGDSLTLTLEFEGDEPKQVPSPEGIPDLQVASTGSSRNISIVNGHYSSTFVATFSLTPTRPGTYTIPPLRALLKGQTLLSKPLTFKAQPADAAATGQSGEQLAFFKIQLTKTNFYQGEVFPVIFQAAVREGVANADNILQSFDSYNACPIQVEDCTVLRTVHLQRRRVQLGNAFYGVSTFVTALSPIKNGPVKIGSINVNLTLQLPAQNQRRRDPFMDPFGMFQQVEEKRVSLTAEPATALIQPLPRENVPPQFNGAVGSYTLSVTAGPTNVAAGDPVTVKIQLSGSGALDSLSLPPQPAWQNFKAYPPTAKLNTADGLGLEGSKVFEQIVVPENADITELPPVSFSFFDPEQGQYRTLTHPAIPLVVRPAGGAVAPTALAAARPEKENSAAAQDIVPNKQHLGSLGPVETTLLSKGWFLGLQSVPVLAFVLALVWRRRADALANNPRLRRRLQTERILREGIQQLRQQAQKNQSEEFFATLFRLLQERLGERLALPATAITEAVIEERLRPKGMKAATLGSLQELFQACNLARYAPAGSPQELAAFIPRLEQLLSELEEFEA